MHTRYQGKSEPLPKEYFTESDDSHENVNEVDSDPDFYPNYSESEETRWSTSSESESSDSESSEEEESKCDEIIPCPCPGKCKYLGANLLKDRVLFLDTMSCPKSKKTYSKSFEEILTFPPTFLTSLFKSNPKE